MQTRDEDGYVLTWAAIRKGGATDEIKTHYDWYAIDFLQLFTGLECHEQIKVILDFPFDRLS